MRTTTAPTVADNGPAVGTPPVKATPTVAGGDVESVGGRPGIAEHGGANKASGVRSESNGGPITVRVPADAAKHDQHWASGGVGDSPEAEALRLALV